MPTDDLDRRLADQAGRDALADELRTRALDEAARLSSAVVEAKRRAKLRESVKGPPRWATVKAALRQRLATVTARADPASVGELARALWALDRTPESVTALLEAALVLPDGRGVLPADLGHSRHLALPTAPILRLLDRVVRDAPHDVLVERVEVLLPCLLRTDLLRAAAALAAIGWGAAEHGRLARALGEARALAPLFDGERLRPEAAWLLRAAFTTGPASAWLASVEPPGPRLPWRLPLTLEELLPFAALLGATFEEGDPARVAIDRWGSNLGETYARHLAEGGGEELPLTGKQVDVRRFLPFDGVLVLGCDATGDTLCLDPRRRTRAGTPPVVRACHDQRLAAELVANGEHELAARALLSAWALAQGGFARPDVAALLATPVALEDDASRGAT